jgi:hypothetical protein
VFEVDWMGQLCRDVLRKRTGALIAESCAWAVGLSDQPHHVRRNGVVVPSGQTVGERAVTGQPLGWEEDERLELGDARPGSFQDALNALGRDGAVHAERFDDEVLVPFVHETCVVAAEGARRIRSGAWAELADDLGEDPADLEGVVRAGAWEAPLRIDAEHLVLAALGHLPLIEVEAEGLPLALVRAAEAATRDAAPVAGPARDEDLAGALFLAEAALAAAGLTLPVRPEDAGRLLDALLAHGVEPDEVTAVLANLPVQQATADLIVARLADRRDG